MGNGGSLEELMRRRYPPDGDVERWVREGPPDHVEYHGGPVEWTTTTTDNEEDTP